jgi:hypothetical protein
MRSQLLLPGLCAFILSAGPLSAAEHFTIEAKMKPGAAPSTRVCAVQVLEHPGGATVIEQELTVSAGQPAIARSGKQDGKGGVVDRKLECSLSGDGRTVTVHFTNTESRKGEEPRVETAETRLKVE